MKRLLRISLIGVCSFSFLNKLDAQAAATNVTITAVVKLDNGLSYTNSVSNGNAQILAAATNAMTQFNLIRASEDPPKSATTNLSQYVIEFNKQRFNLIKDEYDYRMSQDLNVKMQSLSEQKKAEIRALINAP